MHASRLAHSPLLMHSGRQFGGDPIKLGRHEQDGKLLINWHCELGPQGFGRQGFVASTGSSAKRNIVYLISLP